MTDTTAPSSTARGSSLGRIESALPWLGLGIAGLLLPLLDDSYIGVIAQRACIYWILSAGLNLVVGYAGQIAIGWVSMLTLGAYTTAALTAGNATEPWNPYLALLAGGAMGALFGVVVGLPALRLRTFYFAMTTLGFATIVTQVALAWKSVTGGGVGTPGPVFPWPFDPGWGFYYFCFILAALATWMTANIASSRFGRALVAIRDAEVAAEASGIAKPRLLVAVFVFAGALGGIAGGLFSSLQSYITPDAFTFEMSVLFFIGILIGGRGSILGPLLGTIILTVLPEFAAPLVQWSTFLYATLLLVIVLAIPGGIADLLDYKNRRPLEQHREIVPRSELLRGVLGEHREKAVLALSAIELHFGGVRAIDGLDLEIRPGEVHGLIGPNGSGKTTTLNVISGYYRPNSGTMKLGGIDLPFDTPHARAAIPHRPYIPDAAPGRRRLGSGERHDRRHRAGQGQLCRIDAGPAAPPARREAPQGCGDAGARHRRPRNRWPQVRADRLQHSELRFMEIARAMMLQPAFLLLDEPAAGLSADEIRRLGALIKAMSREGTGVLLVEHHADLIFDICDRVTVLNLGKTLAAGTPDEIRSHREVVSAYLGA